MKKYTMHHQKDYLRELSTGPKTTREIATTFSITLRSVSIMMKKLRECGLVKSTKVLNAHNNEWKHTLINNTSYTDNEE